MPSSAVHTFADPDEYAAVFPATSADLTIKAIGVSGRTLRMCCQEHLGMSPKRYLLLRRMHLARRALRDGAPDVTRVTEIATRHGFWQFGRFAGEYKLLFGEAPSATLHRPRE
jgi:transcriptional regulator GlxA family with amidase domain